MQIEAFFNYRCHREQQFLDKDNRLPYKNYLNDILPSALVSKTEITLLTIGF
jgi:hypothetical protein